MGYSFIINIFFAAIGAFFGTLLALWVERKRLPHLTIDPESIARTLQMEIDTQEGYKKKIPYRSIILKIKNEQGTGFFRKWLTILPAIQCRAVLTFLDPKTQQNAIQTQNGEFNLPGRWTDTPLPLPLEAITNQSKFKIYDYNAYRQHLAVDIPPGEHRYLDVVIQVNEESECYAFNNASFAYPEKKNPDFKLSGSEYICQIQLTSGTQNISENFRLSNGGHRQRLLLDHIPREIPSFFQRLFRRKCDNHLFDEDSNLRIPK